MNMPKALGNVAHAAIIASLSYFATHPESSYLWLTPGLAWLGQCLDPPSITVGKPNA